MADENITFNISDQGTTEAFEAALNNLGVTGESVINRLNEALPTYVNAANAAADAQQVLNGYMQAGGQASENLKDTLALLSEVELQAATGSKEFQASLESIAAAEAAAREQGLSLQQGLAAINENFDTFGAGASQAAEKIQALGQAEDQGASLAQRFGEAIRTAGVALVGIGPQAVAAGGAFGTLGGAVRTLTTYFGAYQAAMLVIRDVDAADSITQQLQTVIGAGKDVSGVFATLAATADATQQPLETVVKNFASVYSAIKENGGTIAQATGFVSNLSRALYDTQTPADAAKRVIHDFSEGLATGSLNGRQLTSVLMQAPAIMALVSDALGKNVETLTSHGQATQTATTKLQELEAAANDTGQSVASSKSAYDSAAQSYTKLSTEASGATEKLTELTAQYGSGSVQAQKQLQVVDGLTSSLNNERAAMGSSASAYDQAKDKQDALTKSKIAFQQSVVSNLSLLSQEGILTVFQSKKMQDALNDLAQTAGGTVTGAFTVLNNKFIEFLQQTGDASAITAVFVKGLGFIGNNLSIVIAAITAYIARIALIKLTTVIAEIYAWATGETVLNVQLAITNGLLSPMTLLIVGIGVAVVAIITYFGQWGNILTGIKAIWDGSVALWGAVVTALGDAWNYVVQAMQPIVNTLMPLFKSAFDDIKQDFASASTIIGQLWDDFKSGIANATSKLPGFKVVWEQIKADFDDFVSGPLPKIANFLIQTIGVVGVAAVYVLVAAFKILADVINGILIGINAAITAFQTLKNLGGGGTAGSAGGDAGAAPLSRNGSNFTVAGSSGVDSKLIAVSPGEHVTIQTPMQAKMGYTNDNLPKFRDGGIFTPDNIRNAVFNAATNGSTTGYGVISPSAYYTSGTDAATTTASDSTVSDNTDAMNNLTNVIAGPGGIATSGPAAGNTLPTGGSSGSTGGSSVGSNPYDGSYVGGVQGGSGSTDGSTSDSTGSTTTGATSAQVDAKQQAINADTAALNAALQPATSGGVSRPPSNLQGWSAAQVATWVAINGAVVPKSGLPITYSGDAVGARAKLQQDMNNPASSFRDGGDFMVPGSSGMDSRQIQLAVSPGETVSVRTPQQKQAAQDQLNAGRKSLQTPIININVSAPDPNSFNKSQAQITSQLKQQLSKVA